MDNFDKFAERVATIIASAKWFIFCFFLILLWLPSFLLFEDLEQWQLPINTITTITTFLMVALQENATRRESKAIHKKLDATLALLGELEETSNEIADAAQGIEKTTGVKD